MQRPRVNTRGLFSFDELGGLELIVHAHQDILNIGFGAQDGTNAASTANYEARTPRAEAHVVVFNEERPMRYEHPFDATASRPAGAAVAGN